MRIIVTGSRNLYPRAEATRILFRQVDLAFPAEIMVIHGCCPSNRLRNVDFAFDEAALDLGLQVEQWHPEQYGAWPGCGPRRNAAMVAFGANIGIAYHDNLEGSKGTLGCVRLMLQAGIPVLLYDGSGGPGRTILRLEGNRPIMRNPHDGESDLASPRTGEDTHRKEMDH
jgi:hypothetical protein